MQRFAAMVMWLFITLRRVLELASVMELTRLGSWECRTSVWPRTR